MFDFEGITTEVVADFITTGCRAVFQVGQPFARRCGVAIGKRTVRFAAARWCGFRALALWQQAAQIAFTAYMIVGISAGVSLGYLPPL